MRYRVVWHDRCTGRIQQGVPVTDRSVALGWLRECEKELLDWDLWIEEVPLQQTGA